MSACEAAAVTLRSKSWIEVSEPSFSGTALSIDFRPIGIAYFTLFVGMACFILFDHIKFSIFTHTDMKIKGSWFRQVRHFDTNFKSLRLMDRLFTNQKCFLFKFSRVTPSKFKLTTSVKFYQTFKMHFLSLWVACFVRLPQIFIFDVSARERTRMSDSPIPAFCIIQNAGPGESDTKFL